MRSDTAPFAWMPPLLVGASAAIAAEVALGILLYAGPGFMRSLTTVLAVEGAALGWGLWSAPGPRPDLIEQLRRRWLLCLGAFLVAAVFGTAWSVLEELGGGPAGQGLGLALLAALPLYTCGTVLGGMASIAASDPSGAGRGPGAAAALGAGVGFVITGLLLPRAPIPASLLVACLVLLSAAGMLYGGVLGHRIQIHVRAARASSGGEVRVEDRRLPKKDLDARVLVEGEHVRRRVDLDGRRSVPWDVAVANALMPDSDAPWRVLMLGGGASTLPRTLLEEHPSATVEVLERTGAVIELGRDHLGTELRPGATERVSVRVGNLEDLLADIGGAFDLILVDTSALAPLGGLAALSSSARSRLLSALGPAGVLALGPGAPDPATSPLAEGGEQTVLERSRAGAEERVVLWHARERSPLSGPVEGFGPGGGSPQSS